MTTATPCARITSPSSSAACSTPSVRGRRAAGERQQLRRVRLHDLRHGQASLMLAAGVDMAIVSKRLGHSTVTITTDLYPPAGWSRARRGREGGVPRATSAARAGPTGDSRSQARAVPSQRLELGSPAGAADPENAKAAGENDSSPVACGWGG
ncbi:tyrosine-type recombinase/integrase [Streptomyces sp. TX20-6-3]|uniref:tyrosine-type recombinase/integrase n=1 Tax=Streptomyces sp. TX20-6-3 TaxID=3028705 RepID=UPI0029B567EE|nr:tyrosine-type recombinase/integrase [Streptomyces sp. TX20-6-3]MDX2565262.1 tyrosine-type recombinase/integrase [Streptomyces sp. TX20-6-3]